MKLGPTETCCIVENEKQVVQVAKSTDHTANNWQLDRARTGYVHALLRKSEYKSIQIKVNVKFPSISKIKT